MDSKPLDILNNLGANIILNPYQRKLTASEIKNLLIKHDVIGLIAGVEPLTQDVLNTSTLKVISRCGTGLSNIDIQAAEEKSIQIFNTPDAPTQAVAELTIGALLSLLRMIPQMDNDLRNDIWKKRFGSLLFDKTVGIIGFGKIGKRVSELLRSFNVNILTYDYAELKTPNDILQVTMDELLTKSDIITLHASGNNCLLGTDEFRKIKKDCYILNAARGSLLDENCLIKALQEEQIKGAWIDTFHQEPYNGPLKNFQQVILTPHIGSYAREARIQMEVEASTNLVNFFKSNPVQ